MYASSAGIRTDQLTQEALGPVNIHLHCQSESRVVPSSTEIPQSDLPRPTLPAYLTSLGAARCGRCKPSPQKGRSAIQAEPHSPATAPSSPAAPREDRPWQESPLQSLVQ